MLDANLTLGRAGLSTRAVNTLKGVDVYTVGDLIRFVDAEKSAYRDYRKTLMRLPYFGKMTLSEVDCLIQEVRPSAPSRDASQRDAIALAVLPTIIADMMADGMYATEDDNAERAAIQAFAYADAMLTAREASHG